MVDLSGVKGFNMYLLGILWDIFNKEFNNIDLYLMELVSISVRIGYKIKGESGMNESMW